MTPNALADACRVPLARIERLLREEAPVDADTALRLGRVLGTEPEYWLILQSRFDLAMAAREATDLDLVRLHIMCETLRFEPLRPVDARAFWGKGRPGEGARFPMHPLPWHNLDVAACFAELLRIRPHDRQALLAFFEITTAEDEASVLAGLTVLTALHDIGKFARAFQAKELDLFPSCLGEKKLPPAGVRHDAIGLALAQKSGLLGPLLSGLFGRQSLWPLAALTAIFAHHGRPVDPLAQGVLASMTGGAEGPACRAALAHAEAVYALLGRPVLPKLKPDAGRALSWRLAGLMALADWLGSDQVRFPYESTEWTYEAYWRDVALPRAREAVGLSGLAPAALAGPLPVEHLLRPNAVPSDTQQWAARVPIEGARLYLIEDVMGSGKTEAAVLLAQRLMQAGLADGLYFALPTMATANALYDRMAKFYRLLFAAEAAPSLILAHGARDLHPGFRTGLGPATGAEGMREPRDAADAAAGDAASCARWLGDDRRKAFLADIGVGTVDQALLAVLPTTHAGVRQAGLARKLVILDEIHAYGAYEQREIEALIEHQARLGAPVILLSATLPSLIRRNLFAAHARGLGREGDLAETTLSEAYPLTTVVRLQQGETGPGLKLDSEQRAPREDLCRKVAVRRLDSVAAAEDLVLAAAQGGAAVAYLRNTVDDALESFHRLRAGAAELGVTVELFHARFAMGDRLDIERRIVADLGRDGAPAARARRILVCTQVVEQSIDLDLDLLVTDLAPIDLILQRMGRMWRHSRKVRGWPQPEIAVVSPDPVMTAGKDWYGALFPRGQWVYQDYALLWRSARFLFAEPELDVPRKLRELVEHAYDPAEDEMGPPILQESSLDAQGRDYAHRGLAHLNVIKFDKGYLPGSGAWDSDTRTPTRLSGERVLLRLCHWRDGELKPWCAAPDPKRAWALSELSIRKRAVGADTALPAEIEAARRKLEAAWLDLRIEARAVVVSRRDLVPGESAECSILDTETKQPWRYSPQTGLTRRVEAVAEGEGR